jgi:hypothetical protein
MSQIVRCYLDLFKKIYTPGSGYTSYIVNSRMIGELRIGRNLEGSGRGLI